jgi:hypothetical protein
MELARLASGMVCLLLATLPVDLAVYVTFLFVDGSFWNSTALPAWLDAEVLQGEHRSNKHRPVVTSSCFGSATDTNQNQPHFCISVTRGSSGFIWRMRFRKIRRIA